MSVERSERRGLVVLGESLDPVSYSAPHTNKILYPKLSHTWSAAHLINLASFLAKTSLPLDLWLGRGAPIHSFP